MKTYRVRERAHEELLQDLLTARGVTLPETQAQFLLPDFERDSHDPVLLPDMEKAVERIIFAVDKHEQVAVWSDYDCDGIPGGVALTELLRSIGLSIRHYIPHRHKEGYGLNNSGIDELGEQGITLVITIDLGTTDDESITYAREKGMDIIVTDHHLVASVSGKPVLPKDAFAIINPKRPDSAYPFDGLCGAGVSWKLIQAILAKNRFGIAEGQEKWFLDLIGIATLSDMVPLVDENRMLARFGLMVMRRNRRPGLAARGSMLRIKSASLTEDDVGFMIAPRINAASRMDSPDIAARLLATNDKNEARALAQKLNAINDERKGVVASVVKEVTKRLAASPSKSPLIVMGNPNWRPGILGLVANSLMQSQGKVVCLWGREGGDVVRGSCRSDGSINIVELMRNASDVFEDFGGHAASGGFSLSQDKVHELGLRLEQALERSAQRKMEQEIVVDRELDLMEVPRARRDLEQLSPFGIGNAKPLFIFPNVSIARSRVFGKQNNHLELALAHGGASVSGISFFSSPDSFRKQIEPGMCADIVGHIETDWRGGPRVRIVDVI